MKKIIIFSVLMALLSLTASAQSAAQARKVLDKTATVVGNKGVASASFTMSSPKM